VEGLTAESLAKAQHNTPTAYFLDNLTQVKRAQEALAQLQTVGDGFLGADGPGFVAARQALEDVAHAAERLARDNGAISSGNAGSGVAEPGQSSAASGAVGQVGQAVSGGGVSSNIQSRAQALGQLKLVAEYFRRTEPHSPVAYLADKAVQWGNMPLHVWLRTVLKDGGSLAHVEELLGLAEAPKDQ
jgi:type VI secretion system protein ImpA